MKRYVVVSAVGKDRPGFVNRVTHLIKERGGNIELQRSMRMADEYALLILFSLGGDADAVDGAIRALTALRREDCLVNAREALADQAERPENAQCAELEASGADQPGIIDAVTLLLFQHHINIESMDYDTESAPMTGEHLFRMKARLAVPDTVELQALRDKLRVMEDEFNFDILFRYPVE